MDEVTAGEVRVASASVDAAAPLSRRAARLRSTQPVATQSAAENENSTIDLSPMPAASGRMSRGQAADAAPSDVAVDEILADSVVVVTSQTGPVDLPESVEPAPDPVSAESPADPTPSTAESVTDEDLFTAASQTFRAQPSASFVATPAAETVSEPADAEAHVAPRRVRRLKGRRFVAAGATVGVMGLAGLLAVSMTLPAEAVAAAQGVQATSAMSLVAAGTDVPGAAASDEEIQAFVASSDVVDPNLQRNEVYSAASLVDLAAEEGIQYSDSLYTNDPEAAIQWPFVVGVAMSSGYGPRYGRLHAGIDLVPGSGAPIQSIADGTVRIATESGGAYGVTAYVDHIIDGEVVTSHYAHMQYGSLRVKTGDKVKVGDIIGLVGNTGRSYGAHLHFEIIINGSTVNPLPWMQENAGRYDGVSPVS
ncbi:peptidoglycan DD-metalloendopeptidase family protein [Microbacterium sp. M28]|uniref:M23 family metallopeptidase n=1 Tax=Microbacterium sp. M28 TaxID=2962064 RepID=UPI0021F4C5F6|nr:peptidoglycan DD-metalloendopeptidase family protein [Microbacterium sp. M28]UYO96388.1 peptidoglycan DD-metalloendopeptidase family protein [Microbacterium sp. M28]